MVLPEIVRSDIGGEFHGGDFSKVCVNLRINQEFTTGKKIFQLCGVAARTLGTTQAILFATRILASSIFPHLGLPATELLWVEAAHCASNALNRTGPTENAGSRTPFELWYGLPKSLPKAGRGIFLNLGINHLCNSLQVLVDSGGVVATRDVTWQTPAKVGTVPSTTPKTAEAPVMGVGKQMSFGCQV